MKLQNHYTTPEQSKRLLLIGLPAKSADMFWNNHIGSKMYAAPLVRSKHTYLYKDFFKSNNDFYIPCWSVGRLMEIFDICCTLDLYEDWINTRRVADKYESYIEYIVCTFELCRDKNGFDFRKLLD